METGTFDQNVPDVAETCRRSEAEVYDYWLDASEGHSDPDMLRHVNECSKCRKSLEQYQNAEKAIAQNTNSEKDSVLSKPVLQKNEKGSSITETVESIDGFDVVGPLGEGGMGKVWKAYDRSLDRFLAIKVMRDELTANPELSERFISEAKLAAKLNHPNIVHIHSAGKHAGHVYIAMELVEGQPLSEIIRNGIVDIQFATAWFRQILEGIRAAHSVGIIHRDIKPSNIMVAGDTVKILDFGLAKELHASPVTSLTATGAFVGTLAYMAPEIAAGGKATIQSDLYSAGLVFYEMLTHHSPYSDSYSPFLLIERIKIEPLAEPSRINPMLPKSLVTKTP